MTICSLSDDDNQSDSVVGQTWWETADCWIQTDYIYISIYYYLFNWLSDTNGIDKLKNAKYWPVR